MRRGVTLVEMLIVVTIIGLMVGLSYPAISAGVESLRLNTACDDVASFFNAGLNRAARRQVVVEITIDAGKRRLEMRTPDPKFNHDYELPSGVSVRKIYPEIADEPQPAPPRRFFLFPGGTVPRIGVELANRRGTHRRIQLDPVSGTPQIQ